MTRLAVRRRACCPRRASPTRASSRRLDLERGDRSVRTSHTHFVLRSRSACSECPVTAPHPPPPANPPRAQVGTNGRRRPYRHRVYPEPSVKKRGDARSTCDEVGIDGSACGFASVNEPFDGPGPFVAAPDVPAPVVGNAHRPSPRPRSLNSSGPPCAFSISSRIASRSRRSPRFADRLPPLMYLSWRSSRFRASRTEREAPRISEDVVM